MFLKVMSGLLQRNQLGKLKRQGRGPGYTKLQSTPDTLAQASILPRTDVQKHNETEILAPQVYITPLSVLQGPIMTISPVRVRALVACVS